MDSTSRRDKSPEDKSRSSFTPQVRAAVRRFINEVDQEEREPISKKKVSTIEGLCAAYQDSVKNKRTGDPSGSNAAKRSREEKENGKMFGVRHARTPPAETITYTCISTSFAIKCCAICYYVYHYAWVFFASTSIN